MLNKMKISTPELEKIRPIGELLCQECKDKVTEETKKLSKWDLLKPNRTARRFAKLMCPSCTAKIIANTR